MNYFKPMLAYNYEEYSTKINLEECLSQPKLDGIRCIIMWSGEDLLAFTRNGKRIVTVPHIIDSLKSRLPRHIVLDGELYNHKLKKDFNKIVSLVRKTKPNERHLEDSKDLIEYHVYDLFDTKDIEKVFLDRFKSLVNFVGGVKYINIVETHSARNNNLDELYDSYIRSGYEGQIVRTDSCYENKRSKSLLKRKDFQDGEFLIESVEEGKGKRSGQVGALVMTTKAGKIFRGAIKGTDSFRKDLLKNQKNIIGNLAHVRFFEYTDEGVPRFPVVHSIRNYE